MASPKRVNPCAVRSTADGSFSTYGKPPAQRRISPRSGLSRVTMLAGTPASFATRETTSGVTYAVHSRRSMRHLRAEPLLFETRRQQGGEITRLDQHAVLDLMGSRHRTGRPVVRARENRVVSHDEL